MYSDKASYTSFEKCFKIVVRFYKCKDDNVENCDVNSCVIVTAV
jgi:hypothetical protein